MPALLKAFLVRSVLCPGPFGCGEQAGHWGSPAVGGASSGVGAAVAGRAGQQQGLAAPRHKEAEGRTMGVHRTWQLEIRDVTGPVWTLGTQDPAEPRPRGEAGRAEGSASLRTAEAGEWQEGGWGWRLCLEAEGLRRWNRGAGCCRLTAGRGPPGAREPDAGGCPESAEGSGRGEGASEGTGIGNDIEVAGPGLSVRQRPLMSRASGRSAGGRRCTARGPGARGRERWCGVVGDPGPAGWSGGSWVQVGGDAPAPGSPSPGSVGASGKRVRRSSGWRPEGRGPRGTGQAAPGPGRPLGVREASVRVALPRSRLGLAHEECL